MSNPLQGNPDGPELRKKAGAFLRKARTDAGLTQMDLAKAMGAEYFTLVSQIERGKARRPPDKMMVVCLALGWQPCAFCTRLQQFYDPYGWKMLWGPEATADGRTS